ncbi:MAG: RuBisCO large subunit C-terminal-like domain-containing protein [Actinomycetota bacterium]|nr:RuBisCO large subunit C-terminal-like domain-containing protein [Actinomycetota bacterium]
MMEPTQLSLSGERLLAVYEFAGPVELAESRANALRVEQTIEFPADLVPDDDIQNEIIGRIESLQPVGDELARAEVSYAVETTGSELPQLLNVLMGNSGLLPGIRLIDFTLPASLSERLVGPRFGVAGLRKMFDAPTRPLLSTALKPMGLSAERLAETAFDLAVGGIDMIKDDHSLADQPFARFAERVARCADAVRRANDQTGLNTIYMPSINAPYDLLGQRVHIALEAGVGGLLVLPGITGFDHMRALAADDDVAIPIMGHPAFLGAFSASPTTGIAHRPLYGTLMRLAGADLSIFPNFGGRFSFSPKECRDIAEGLCEPIAGVFAALPAPGGGMTLDRVPEIKDFYGSDVALLVGGDLHRGESLVQSAAAFREAVES